MGLKVMTNETDSKLFLPNYIVSLLLYYYIKTSKVYFLLFRELQNGKVAFEK